MVSTVALGELGVAELPPWAYRCYDLRLRRRWYQRCVAWAKAQREWNLKTGGPSASVEERLAAIAEGQGKYEEEASGERTRGARGTQNRRGFLW